MSSVLVSVKPSGTLAGSICAPWAGRWSGFRRRPGRRRRGLQGCRCGVHLLHLQRLFGWQRFFFLAVSDGFPVDFQAELFGDLLLDLAEHFRGDAVESRGDDGEGLEDVEQGTFLLFGHGAEAEQRVFPESKFQSMNRGMTWC